VTDALLPALLDPHPPGELRVPARRVARLGTASCVLLHGGSRLRIRGTIAA